MNANQNFPYLKKKVAATGKLQNFTRKTLMAMLKEHGAYPRRNVSNRTDYLIVGERPGVKLEKALSLGICIVPENTFETLLTQYYEQQNQDGTL